MTNCKSLKASNTIKNSIILFIICLVVHSVEVLFIRTDETAVSECFINKVFGIILLFIVLKKLNWHWRDIGFVKEKFIKDALKGILLCCIFYGLAFMIEFVILSSQGTPGHMEFYVTGFSLTGNVVKRTGIGFVLLCVFFNIINVWMEEGLFRGFYITYIGGEHPTETALYIASLLFGIWHIVTPLRGLIDGDMTFITFAVMSAGYVVLSALMGIKWGLLFRMSGDVWIGLADHFFNNCVVTNLLHVVSSDGVDSKQVVRVLIGELTSFVAVLIIFCRANAKKIR